VLLGGGWTFRQIQEITYASAIPVAARRFRHGGAAALWQEAPDQPLPVWRRRVAAWLAEQTPQDFGSFRSRRAWETLIEVLAWETGRLSAETVLRGPHRTGFA
jgi:hypothetical protein